MTPWPLDPPLLAERYCSGTAAFIRIWHGRLQTAPPAFGHNSVTFEEKEALLSSDKVVISVPFHGGYSGGGVGVGVGYSGAELHDRSLGSLPP